MIHVATSATISSMIIRADHDSVVRKRMVHCTPRSTVVDVKRCTKGRVVKYGVWLVSISIYLESTINHTSKDPGCHVFGQYPKAPSH